MRREDWESEEATPNPSPPPPVGDLVAVLSSARGWAQRLRGARIHSAWPQIAGEELARHVTPVRLAGGVLVVRAASTAWATQVSYLAPQLRDRANAVLGAGEVRSVTVQTTRPDKRSRN
ncbi:MAG: DUF721 domain-containing protein [Nitriliruptorales bacterium]|nr:DUF721 domain-containing protein [Nitriliruptorales bacterium]